MEDWCLFGQSESFAMCKLTRTGLFHKRETCRWQPAIASRRRTGEQLVGA
jgi:hypothetical protein